MRLRTKSPNGDYYPDIVYHPYKGRRLNREVVVLVYRNLRKRGIWYSIVQGGLVVGHATSLTLRDVKFIVHRAGQERMLKTGHKNVHAFAEGKVTDSGMGSYAGNRDETDRLPAHISYNPKRGREFMITNLTLKPVPVKGAMVAFLNQSGVTAAYTH